MDLRGLIGLATYIIGFGLTYEVFMTGYGWRRDGHEEIDPGTEWMVAGVAAVFWLAVLPVIASVALGRKLVTWAGGVDDE